ncbi:MAG: fibronectin type III domain-containing protein [Kiritimatiellae bacterium]|nr:fibronectin type III domain-containing protein [Kiritimatiellia bacterium]
MKAKRVVGVGCLLGCLLIAVSSDAALSVRATWNPNSESDLAGYRLWWGTNSRGSATSPVEFRYWTNKTVGVSAQPATTVDGIDPNFVWYFALTAFDTGQNESLYGNEVVFRYAATPTAPSGLTVTVVSASRLDLAWVDNSGDETGFKIDRRQSGQTDWARIAQPGADVTRHTDSGLPAGTKFYYQVKAFNAAGNSAYCAVAAATTAARGAMRLVRIANGADDVEEQGGGSVYAHSSDLELTEDGGAAQTVGLRFAALDVPRGATIRSAYVQFQVDEPGAGVTSLQIRGHATGHARAFTDRNGDVTARPTTSAAVPWTVPAWNTAGAAGADQRTPDLAAVIQEIVRHDRWMSGNALVLVVTGTGKRTAEAYEGDPAGAPLLVVEYESGLATDTDADGMDDAWETAQFGATNAPNSGARDDYDGDGFSNWEEFVAGTDPKAGGTSYFDCDLRLAAPHIIVSFPTVPASGPGYTGYTRYYALERAGSLNGDAWGGVPGHTNIAATGGAVTYTNTFPPPCIFRARVWLE